MQKLIYLLFIGLMTSPILAQNFVLDYSGGRYHEITRLQTDSMYVVSGTQTREAAFEFDANQRLTMSRYRLVESAQNFEVRKIIVNTYSPNKLISIDSSTTILPFPGISLSRTTTDSLNGKVVSFTGETSYNGVWKETQKDTFIYDASNRLIEISSQFWDFVAMAWKYTSFQRFEYDAQSHISIRRELGVGNSITDTTTYNEYIYAYNANGQIKSDIWKNGSPLINIGKETYAYDNSGNLDSLNAYNWNTVLQIWQPDFAIVLDDSPEQQATNSGKRFKLNNQGQWYLDSDAFYTPGPHIYTDEPAEKLIRNFNANTNQLENYERVRTTYLDLPDGCIKGDLQRAYYSSGNWQNALHVEAWQRKVLSVGLKTPTPVKATPCGLPNPMVLADLPVFLPEIVSTAQLGLFSMDGKLVLSQSIGNKASLQNAFEPPPALYWLMIRDKSNIICTQRVVLH